MAQLRHQPHWFIKMVPRRAVKHSRGCAHGNEKVRVGKILGDRRKIKLRCRLKNVEVIKFFN